MKQRMQRIIYLVALGLVYIFFFNKKTIAGEQWRRDLKQDYIAGLPPIPFAGDVLGGNRITGDVQLY